jgi:hypothetical protein
MEGARDWDVNTKKYVERFKASLYQLRSEKDASNGYAGLDTNNQVAAARLGSGTCDATTFLRGPAVANGPRVWTNTLNGPLVLPNAPTLPTHAANKAYVDAIAFEGALPFALNNYGVKFTWTSTSTITLTPSGVDGKAVVFVKSSVDGSVLPVLISTPLVWDITKTGPGGLDTGSEAASTGYEIRLITKEDGSGMALIGTVNGNALTAQVGYTRSSSVIGFASNTEGGSFNNIYPFHCTADYWWYDYPDAGVANTGIQLLSNGRATSSTAIDCSDYIPAAACEGTFWGIAINISTTARSAEAISGTTGAKTCLFRTVQTNDAYETVSGAVFQHPFFGAPATDMKYRWQPSAPGVSDGYSLYVMGFRVVSN